MQAAFGDVLFAFVEQSHLWLSPTYQKQVEWWQVPLDETYLRQEGSLEYGQLLLDAYLQLHPGEEQRVGRPQILAVMLRALDALE